MQDLDLYVVNSWCRDGSMIFLFDAGTSEGEAWNHIQATLRETGLYRERFWFCLNGFHTIGPQDEKLRVRTPRYTDFEITITKLPVRIPKDERLVSFAYVDFGTNFWDMRPDKEGDDGKKEDCEEEGSEGGARNHG